MGDKFKRGRKGTERFFKKHGKRERFGRKQSARPPVERGRRGSYYDPDERY